MRGRGPVEATVQRVILFSLREGWGSELVSGWYETHFSAPHTGVGTSDAEGLTQPQRVVLRPLRLGRGQDVLPGREGQGKVCQLKFLTK